MLQVVDSPFVPGCSAHSKRLNEFNSDVNANKAQWNMQSDRVGGCEGKEKRTSRCQKTEVSTEKERREGERQELRKGRKDEDRCEDWGQQGQEQSLTTHPISLLVDDEILVSPILTGCIP